MICLALTCFLSIFPNTQTHTNQNLHIDKWVNEQVKTLKDSEADNPAEQSKALFSLVFVTHHVTADKTTLSSDWAKVTSDGSESFPQSVDPYDLAERMRLVADKLKWPLAMADSDMGPAMIFGEGDKKQIMLVNHGQRGLWKSFQKNKSDPKALNSETWQKLLKARQALLRFRSGDKTAFKKMKFDDFSVCLLTECALLKGKQIPIKKLVAFIDSWPKKSIFSQMALIQARKIKDKKVIHAIITKGLKNPNIPFLIHAAYHELSLGNDEKCLSHLSKALTINPFHARTLQLLKAIRRD